jgi:hypothetical protein
VQRREIGDTKWEFTVGGLAGRKNQAVTGTIHGFQPEIVRVRISAVVVTATTRGHQEHVLLCAQQATRPKLSPKHTQTVTL